MSALRHDMPQRNLNADNLIESELDRQVELEPSSLIDTDNGHGQVPPIRGDFPLSPDEIKNRNDWLRIAYVETWKQYVHEDTSTTQRSSIFLIVQTALLATLASLSAVLIKLDPEIIGWALIPVGYGSIGLISIVFGYFALRVLAAWKGVFMAGVAYVAVRRSTALRIEREVNLDGVSLAEVEVALRLAAVQKHKDFRPYTGTSATHMPSLMEDGLLGIGVISEFAIDHLIKTLQTLWKLIIGVGCLLVLVAILSTRPAPTEAEVQRAMQGTGGAIAITISPTTLPRPQLIPGVTAIPTGVR